MSPFFYWLFLGEVSPWNFPWNRPIFLWICPWKSFEIWLFSAKMPQNQPIFLRILTFLPWNLPIFSPILTFSPRNRPIFPRIWPWKSREILLFFFPRNIRSPVSFTKGLKDKAEAYTFHEVLSPSLNHFTRLCSNGAQSPEATEKKFLVARPGILASGAVFS